MDIKKPPFTIGGDLGMLVLSAEVSWQTNATKLGQSIQHNGKTISSLVNNQMQRVNKTGQSVDHLGKLVSNSIQRVNDAIQPVGGLAVRRVAA